MEILQNNTIFKKNKGLKRFIVCNLILFSFSLYGQDLIRSNNTSTIHYNSNLILHSIGQTIAPEFNDIIYFGFRSPLTCLLYTSPSPRDRTRSRMPSSA